MKLLALFSFLFSFSVFAQQAPVEPAPLTAMTAELQLVNVVTPGEECAQTYEGIKTFLEDEKSSFEATKKYLASALTTLVEWRDAFKTIEQLSADQKTKGVSYVIPKDYFQPLLDSADSIEAQTAQIRENSGRLEDAFYVWLDAAAVCNMDEELFLEFENYIFEARVLDAIAADAADSFAGKFRELSAEYTALENQKNIDVQLGHFTAFEKLASSDDGSGGFGELNKLYVLLKSNFDLPLLEELVAKLEPEEES